MNFTPEADNPFLKDLKLKDFENLLLDNELRRDGVHVFYVVDTYDIIEYCFPYREKDAKQELEFKTKTLAYDFLFYENSYKPIVPNEYLAELSSFMYHLKFDTKNTIDAFQDIENLFSKRNKENIKNNLDYFYSNITVFLAIQHDLLSPSSIERFNDILKNRLNAFDLDVSQGSEKEILLDVFHSTGKSDLTNQIFEQYYEKISHEFMRSNPSVDECYRQLNNTYKDIVVIDRLIAINNRVYEKNKLGELAEKYLFLYVSSTPFKSDVLFNLPIVIKNLPTIYGQKGYDFLRNSKQLYFQSIATLGQQEKLFESTLKFLKTSIEGQKQIDRINKIESKLGQRNLDVQKVANFNLQRRTTRNEFDLVSKLNKFHKNKGRLKNAIEGIKENTISFKKFKSYIHEILDSKEFEKKASQVFEHLYLHTANYDFQERVLQITLTGERVRPIPGNDTVKSTFQHLPILIFFRKQNILTKSKWYKFLRTISDYLTDSYLVDDEKDQKEFIAAYISIVSSYKNRKIASPIETTIILNYLSLLIPSPKKNRHNGYKFFVDQETILIDKLERLKKVLNYSNIKYEFDNESLLFKKKNYGSKYQLEIDYLLVWIYRRQKQFDKAIKLATKVLNIFPNEPRILQGLALAYLSKTYSNNNETDIDSLKKSESLLIKSRNEYLKYAEESKYRNILLNKTIIAILNSLCNVNINIYRKNKLNSYKQKAYSFHDEFKDFMTDHIKMKIDAFPAFCDTTSWLLTLKSRDELKEKNIDAASSYYNEAKFYFEICNNSLVYENIPNKKALLKTELRNIKKSLMVF